MINLDRYKANFDDFRKICSQVDRELLSFSFLAGGGHNDHFLLETRNKGRLEKLVARIRATDQFQNIYNEYNILKKLKGRYGPHCLYIDTDCKILPRPYLLLEYIDGPLYKHDYDKGVPNELIRLAAKYYDSLHSINGPFEKVFVENGNYSIKKSFDYHFKSRYNSSKHVLPSSVLKRIDYSLYQIKEIEDDLTWSLESKNIASMIQGDPTIGNLVYWNKRDSFNANKILFLDWEFARYDLPEFDLVFFLDTYEVSQEGCASFLAEYNYFSKGGDVRNFLGIWLCHLMRIIAWRVERASCRNIHLH